MDGRAEKSLQVQGVCVLQVGVGTSGKLRVSSGLVVAFNPAGNRGAPNAPVLNKTQEKSKMSQSVHAEIGNIYIYIYCITNADQQRAIRTIGWVQTSCTTPYRWQNSRRNSRGGVVGAGGCLGLGQTIDPCRGVLCKCQYYQNYVIASAIA